MSNVNENSQSGSDKSICSTDELGIVIQGDDENCEKVACSKKQLQLLHLIDN